MYKAVLKHVSAGNEMVVVDATDRWHSKKDGKFTVKPLSAKSATKGSKLAGQVSKTAGSLHQPLNDMYNDMSRRNKNPRKDQSNLSDAELQKILNRERMELEYDRYFNTPQETAGQKFTRGFNAAIPYIQVAATLAALGLSAYATFHKDPATNNGGGK